MKYEVGDVVTIGNNFSSHGFFIGEQVIIVEVRDGDYVAEHLDGSDYWFIGEEEIKSEEEIV